MNLLVAGITFIVAAFIGIISQSLASFFGKTDDEENTEKMNIGAVWSKSAAMLSGCLGKGNRKEMVYIIITALLCAVMTYRHIMTGTELVNIIKYVVIALVLVVVMIIDKSTHRIPNITVLCLFLTGILWMLLETIYLGEEVGFRFLVGVAGFIACFLLFYIMSAITHDGMGMGDIKIIGMLGWNLGIGVTLIVALAALILSTVVAVFLLFGKKKNKNEQFPFGPFLFFGYILVMMII